MPSDSPEKKVVSIAAGRERHSDNKPDVCQSCFGTGTRIEEGKGAVICDCRRTNTGARRLESARIPPRFRECSFHNYYPKHESQYFAHSFAARLVEDYPAVDTGLLLMGPVGVGKTHLAISILKELIEKKGVACLFYESGSLLKTIQDSYNPISKTSEMRVLAPVYQAEVLVLDELGASVPTDWVRDTLYQIINTRYNNKKLTIFTTNYLDDPRLEKPENGESNSRGFSRKRDAERIRALTTLEDQIGTPLRSRLYEMCRKVSIEGEDYRRHLNERRADPANA